MSGFEPESQKENEELAALSIQAIKEAGMQARVAVWGLEAAQYRYAAHVLIACWERRNKWGIPGGEA